MLKATTIFTLATLSTLMGSIQIAQAQPTTSLKRSESLQGIHNKPTQEVFFRTPKLKRITPSSLDEQNTWTRNLSKDWVIQTQQNRSSSTVLQPDTDRNNSDLRVLFRLDKPNP